MKTLMTLILALGSLLFLLPGPNAEVSFHNAGYRQYHNPHISYGAIAPASEEITRWIDQGGAVTWDDSQDQNVDVTGWANGLGQGKASFINFRFNGGSTIAQLDGSPTKIGRTWITNGFLGFFKKRKYAVERNGQAIRARKTVTLPNEPGTYTYTSEGKVVLQPYFWQQTTGGTTVNISITGISGSFSDGSGRWMMWTGETMTTTRYAEHYQTGSWTVVNKYRCKLSQCQEEEASAAALERDHGYQASCDTSGCTATGFYECQHTTHSFAGGTPQEESGSRTNNQYVSSGCYNNTTYNWCSDTGSCTTRSKSGVPGECGHNYCCCAPSGSPIYNGGSSSSSGSSDSGSSGSGSGSDSAVTCGNCSARVSSSSAHQATCDLGHTYWTCGSQYSVNLHSVRHSNRTCVRCGTTFNSRTNGTCNSRWGTRYSYHWEG